MKSIKKIEKGICMNENHSPLCGDGDVVIGMGACGICGSDLSNISGDSCKPTTKIGHEVAGVIIKLGAKVKGFKIGDRVFVNHHASCGKCYLCEVGRQTLCDKFVDSLEPCGMSEEFLLPEWNVKKDCLFKIPDSLSFEEASLAEPLGCCIRAWKKIPHDLDSVMIFGSGTIGMIHALLANHYGYKTIFSIDIIDFRLKFAQKTGLRTMNFSDVNLEEKILNQTNNMGADIAIIATSDMTTVSKAIDTVRRGGMILLMGEPSFDSKCIIDISKMYGKEISIVTSYAATNEDIRDALSLITTRAINVSQLITHRFLFKDSIEAIEKARLRKDCLKVVISGTIKEGF